MNWTWNLAASAAVAWIVSIWFKYQKALARVHHLPGTRLVFNPYSPIAFMLPRVKYLGVGSQYGWDFKRSIGILSGTPGYIVSNVDGIKQVFASRSTFVKHTKDYGTLNAFGPNLVATEGDQWKRMRRICAPAFSDRNNNYVWSTTTELVDEMTSNWANDEPTVVNDICQDMTVPLGLCVIAKAGFGQDVTWADTAPPPGNHKLTFKKALSTVTQNIFLPVVLPDWAWWFSKHWMFVKEAYNEVLGYLNEMIDLRRNARNYSTPEDLDKHDLFIQLLSAHDEGDRLTTEELIGNMFVFLIAGHETASHTLGFLLGLLALYPEEQDILLAHIEQNRPQSRDFAYEDIHKLNRVMATLYETLRLYPSIISIPKMTSEDTQMNLGVGESISIPSGTRVSVNIVGVHYNPQYWDDPFNFLPSRFLDNSWNRDAFMPFALGARSCIGKRFAETTIIALVVRLLPKYRISVDERKFKPVPGETMIERRERFMGASSLFTLHPQKLPLVFTPRG
ncbi:cytochrome P450 family protein [Ceratobasidium sp. AG-Ba]|nr:cytochrome P450 family protein [Ceratobasidium sp. AG-Ba]QRW01966.1 cytochrome P450 family protein [Ceratobasidium sp. AG-Ba]